MKNNCIFLCVLFVFLRHFVLFYMCVCLCVMCAGIPVCNDTHMPHMGVKVRGQSWLLDCL